MLEVTGEHVPCKLGRLPHDEAARQAESVSTAEAGLRQRTGRGQATHCGKEDKDVPAPLGAPGDDVVCGWVPHHVIPAHKACLSRRCSGEACGQRAKARRSRLCQERRRLVLLRLVPGVLIAAHWPLRAGAAAGGARGRHCLRAGLQLPGLAPQAICARLTTETARFSVARRSVPAGLAYTPVLPGSALVLLLSVAKVYLTCRPSSEQAVPAKHCSSSATATRGCALSVRVQVATQALQPREGAGMDFRCAPLGARAAAPLCKRLPARCHPSASAPPGAQ